jgi:tetratricopeptide (TPR) repeat protein
MKTFVFIQFLCLLLLAGCQKSAKTIAIVKPSDYDTYLKTDTLKANKTLADCNAEIAFWQKQLTTRDTGNYVYMLKTARLLTQRFRLTGEAEDLIFAEKLFKKANQKLANKEASIYYSLSQNAVTQHQFRQAMDYNQLAAENGGNNYVVSLLMFDVGMELGSTHFASQNLQHLKEKDNFDYLIRHAKYKDHQGDLDSAILLMETAFDKIKNTNNKALYCWALSNLGDMYGHANRIEDSYRTYLKVLEKDPDYDYVLKGIAHIAFSHDKNVVDAKKIYNYLLSKTKLPDLNLELAELAEFEGNQTQKMKYLDTFREQATQAKYGDMYNKYLVLLYNGDLKNEKEAFRLSMKEVNNRPSGQSYDLLAWSYLNQGDKEKALKTADDFVRDFTFEPDAFYHLGMIYKANNKPTEARKYLKLALESSFELGPIITEKIEKELKNL